jgi:hypothetical protein
MKRFIFTVSEGKAPRGGSGITYYCRIYQIKRNDVEFIGRGSGNHVGASQLVLETMEKLKLLPKKAFVRNPNTGGMVHASLWSMKNAGIADITLVS